MEIGLESVYLPSTENIEQPKLWERYFEQHKAGLQTTIAASLQTEYGQHNLSSDQDLFTNPTLDSFLSLPQLTPEKLAGHAPDFMIKGEINEDFYTAQTTGSGGVRKEIRHRSTELIAPIDQNVVDFVGNSRHPILLKDADSHGTSIQVIKKSLDALTGKEIPIENFTFPNQAVEAITRSEADTIYLIINPTLARLLFSGWEEMLKNGDPTLQELKGRNFLLELAGERITISELDKWDELLSNIFGELTDPALPRIVSIYGQSEQLMIGKYEYQRGDKQVSYTVKDNKFCLILDESEKPVIGKEGRLEVTTTLTEADISNGKTVLPRYLTGDVATAEFDETGKLKLVEVRRDPEREMISISGTKIFLGDIPKQLDESGYPTTQIEYQISGEFPAQVLTLKLIPNTTEQEYGTRLTEAMKQIIAKNYADIAGCIINGALKVKIELSSDVIEKRWKLLKPLSLSKEQYQQINSDISADEFN